MKRWIQAPTPDHQPQSGTITGVWVEHNEQVQWIWSYLPDNRSIITGYEITPAFSD